jgi:serine/threonine protein kinase
MEKVNTTRRIADYVLGSMLGKGAFGHVRAAKRLCEPEKIYAIKYMKVGQPHSKDNLIRSLQQEAIMRKIEHSNILHIYEVNPDGVYEKNGEEPKRIPVVYAVLQLARNGDLFDFVVSTGGLSENVARFYFNQILNVLEFLHSMGIAHRDMKPENILLDQNFNTLLTDFGLCKKLTEIGFVTTSVENRVGTERCMSPELYAGTRHSPIKDDLFALGYMLFMIVARHPPFTSTAITNEHYRLFRENKILEYWKAIDSLHPPKWCTENFKHLITLMLAANMSIRPSISEIRAHPWMQGLIPTETEIVAEFDKRQVSVIEYQKKEAKARKIKKEEKAKKALPVRQGFISPHYLKRSVVQKASVDVKSNCLKMLEVFGEFKEHKPTVLLSQEDADSIETALKSFFVSAKTVKIDQRKYKVILFVTCSLK